MGRGVVAVGEVDHPLADAIDQDRLGAVGLDREAVGQVGEGHPQAGGDPLAGGRLRLLGQLRPPRLGVEAAVEQARVRRPAPPRR